MIKQMNKFSVVVKQNAVFKFIVLLSLIVTKLIYINYEMIILIYLHAIKRLNVFIDPPTTENAKSPVAITMPMLDVIVMEYNWYWFNRDKPDTNKWLTTTYDICILLPLSHALKSITLQNVCRRMMHNACAALVSRKLDLPPNNPIVAGPTFKDNHKNAFRKIR